MSEEERSTEVSMDELAALVETAGGEAVAQVLQNRAAPDPRSFIGEGKVREIKELIQANDCSLAVFDNELSPSQMRVLSEELGVKVLDRSGLILDIFAQRARTREGKLQVELAQYNYLLPRLTGMWKHLVSQTAAAANPPLEPAARAKHSLKRTGGIYAGRFKSSRRNLKPSERCAQSSGPGGKRTQYPWWRWWATPTRESQRCSTALQAPRYRRGTGCSTPLTPPPAA